MPTISTPYACFNIHVNRESNFLTIEGTDKNLNGRLLFNQTKACLGPVLKILPTKKCGGGAHRYHIPDAGLTSDSSDKWVASFIASDFGEACGIGAHCIYFQEDFVVDKTGFVWFSKVSVIVKRFFVRGHGILQCGLGKLPPPDKEPVAFEECMMTCLDSYGEDPYRNNNCMPIADHGRLVAWGTNFHLATSSRSDFDFGPHTTVQLYVCTLYGASDSYHHLLSNSLTLDHVTFKGCEAPEFMCTPDYLRRVSSIGNKCGMSFFPPSDDGHVTITDLLVLGAEKVIKRNHRNRLLLIDPHLPTKGQYPGTSPVCVVVSRRTQVLGTNGCPVVNAQVRYLDEPVVVRQVCADKVLLADAVGFTHIRKGDCFTLCDHEYHVTAVISPTEIRIGSSVEHEVNENTTLQVFQARQTGGEGFVDQPVLIRQRYLARNSRHWCEFQPPEVYVKLAATDDFRAYGKATLGVLVVPTEDDSQLQIEYSNMLKQIHTLNVDQKHVLRKNKSLRHQLKCQQDDHSWEAACGEWRKKYENLNQTHCRMTKQWDLERSDFEDKCNEIEKQYSCDTASSDDDTCKNLRVELNTWQERYYAAQSEVRSWETRYFAIEDRGGEHEHKVCELRRSTQEWESRTLRLEQQYKDSRNEVRTLRQTNQHLQERMVVVHNEHSESVEDHRTLTCQHVETQLRAHMWRRKHTAVTGFVSGAPMLVVLVEFIVREYHRLILCDTQHHQLFDLEWRILPEHASIQTLYSSHINVSCDVCMEPRFTASRYFPDFRSLREYVYNLCSRNFEKNWMCYDTATRVILCRWFLVPFVYHVQIVNNTQYQLFRQQFRYLMSH